MKHYRIVGSQITTNLSRAVATGKVLTHYDVISKFVQHLHGEFYVFTINQTYTNGKQKTKFYCVFDVRVHSRRNQTTGFIDSKGCDLYINQDVFRPRTVYIAYKIVYYTTKKIGLIFIRVGCIQHWSRSIIKIR